MDRNDYVRPQTLIDALPEEPTEEYVMVRRIMPLAIMRSDSLCGFSYYELYMMGYRDAMKEWCNAIDKTDAAISTADFDGLWEQLFAATAVARGAVQRVEELRATNAALSASFCEEKEALEAKIKELEKQVDEANATIFDLRKELDCVTRIREKTEAQANRDRRNRDKTIDVLLDIAVRPLAESDSLFYGRTWILADERGDIHRCASYDSVGGVKPIILGTIARGGAIICIERRNPKL